MAERVYQVEGGYYPPHKVPQDHLQSVLAVQRAQPNKYKGNPVTSWWGQPRYKEVSEQDMLWGRRPDLTTGGMETLRKGYDKETMGNLLDAYRNAQALDPKFPKLTPEQLTRMALEEGRSNFGYNEWDVNNKKLQKVVNNLKELGHDDYSAGFAAAIKEKYDTAKRLGQPFEQLWNGAGPKAREYYQRIQKGMYSVDHPDNKEMRDYIKFRITPQQRSEADVYEGLDNPLMAGSEGADFYG